MWVDPQSQMYIGTEMKQAFAATWQAKKRYFLKQRALFHWNLLLCKTLRVQTQMAVSFADLHYVGKE